MYSHLLDNSNLKDHFTVKRNFVRHGERFTVMVSKNTAERIHIRHPLCLLTIIEMAEVADWVCLLQCYIHSSLENIWTTLLDNKPSRNYGYKADKVILILNYSSFSSPQVLGRSPSV